jgi:hypothetical protein
MAEDRYIPKQLKDYDGNQIYKKSGRLIFVADDDSVIVLADKSVYIEADTVNIEADSEIITEAKQIYLGANSYNKSEPTLRGTKTEKLLEKIIDSLDTLSQTLATSISTPTGTPIVSLVQASAQLKGSVTQLRTLIKSIKSEKIYVE